MLLILLTLGVVILSVIFRGFIRQLYLASKFPGPPAYPIIGNAYIFLNKDAAGHFEVMKQIIKEYGKCIRMWLGNELTFFITDAKDAETILSSQQLITKASLYELFYPWLNDGLLVSTGKKWHQRRKILTPAFHFKILDQFVDIFDQQSQTLVDVLSKIEIGEKVELVRYTTLYALDVICETAMGTTKNAQLDSNSTYTRAVRELQSTEEVIAQRRDELINAKNSSKTSDELQEFGIKRRKAFLDILLEARVDGVPLSDADIREEVDTFMFEGHDTTTSGITFTLYCIAKYPDVQKKCFEEIVNVIGTDKHQSINVTDLNNLHYLENVIKESMRMYPPVPLYGRITTEETEINGKLFPTNSTLMLPIYFMLHNPEYFDDPETFRPERFDMEEKDEKSIPTFAYVPFSAGPRNCIGQKFATLDMKSAVSKVLRHFEITLAEDSKMSPILMPELILSTVNPLNFYLKPRVY